MAGVAVGEGKVEIEVGVEVGAAGTGTGGDAEADAVFEMVANSHTTSHKTLEDKSAVLN